LYELLRVVKRLGVPIVCLTGNRRSTLGEQSDVVLDVRVAEEACPHDLAPTASTTAALAMGDALAVATLMSKGFTPHDFAMLHPGGALGRRLLRVADVMLTGPESVPVLPPAATLREAMMEIAHKRGTVAVVDEERRIVGVVTAGDLTRFADDNDDFLQHSVSEAMNRSPKTVTADMLAAEALFIMERHGIMALPVRDAADRLSGMVHLHDLMRARVV
jgi:arabinose-5-phosphate isomerase